MIRARPNGLRLLFLCASILVTASATARSLQTVRNHGTVRIGVALATPWVMRDRDDALIGYEIDLGRKLAADLKVQPSFVVYPADALERALESDEIDVVIAGLTITPERALRVNFSNPHTHGGMTLATNLQSTASVASLADLDSPEHTLAIVRDTVAGELAARLMPRIDVQAFDSIEAAGAALVAGEVDAYLEEEPIPTFLALDNPARVDVPIARELLATEAGFALGKGDPDFVFYLNAWIVAHESDTWLPTTHDYWFKSLRWRDRLRDVPEIK
jgi:polar amino acid transport system substrate-binding protein